MQLKMIPRKLQSKQFLQTQNAQKNEGNITNTNQIQQNFAIKLQNGQTQSQTPDYTVAWTYQIPVLKQNQNALFLQIETFSTTIHDYIGDNYPQTISIGLRGFNGFIGTNGLPTSKIIVMNLSNIATTTMNGMISRDLVYTSNFNGTWALGSMRNLIFECFVDESTNPINFPIQNPISLLFKILHMTI